MALFAVHYEYSESTADVRAEHRPKHRSWVSGNIDAGVIVSSGPYTDGTGALFLVNGESTEDVAGVFDQDPFALMGYVGGRRIVEWLPVLGAFS